MISLISLICTLWYLWFPGCLSCLPCLLPTQRPQRVLPKVVGKVCEQKNVMLDCWWPTVSDDMMTFGCLLQVSHMCHLQRSSQGEEFGWYGGGIGWILGGRVWQWIGWGGDHGQLAKNRKKVCVVIFYFHDGAQRVKNNQREFLLPENTTIPVLLLKTLFGIHHLKKLCLGSITWNYFCFHNFQLLTLTVEFVT